MFFYQQFDKVIYIPILLERGTHYINLIRKITIDQSAFYQSYQKYLKELCLYKSLLFLKAFLTNSNADSVKVVTPSNVCQKCYKYGNNQLMEAKNLVHC